ncbi:MAG: carboxypeptidase-like regulatory domain-containing protein [Bacteroidota bacterium]|nr:carboxypeptidase-like regulatory domain-containing protein [Bacteroidota bacterium]MDP3143874.1 carboxypeptidase-like regulatory domain-containing protein [Bacteroidota bacterium]MDP3558022.1 carboxypeptidase-like regulatory domain-containing protein [Bacteroidota bacterium]
MNRLKFTTVLLVSLQFCFGQQMTIHFMGKIYNDKNAVIGGANVQVVQDAFLTSNTQTDVDGNYNLYLPLNREFDVTIVKEGYVQKKFFVSTKGIKESTEMTKFPTYVADVVLFTRYDGIDYSLFDQPINKYQYNAKNNNIDYDEPYLKEMKEAMKEIKKAEREAIKLIREKQAADRKLLAASKVGYIPQNTPALPNSIAQYKPSEQKFSVANTSNTNRKIDSRTLALLAKYKQGVTEEIIEGNGVYIIQRILVIENDVWMYQKKIFNWGGVACFRDQSSITEGVFEQETKK